MNDYVPIPCHIYDQLEAIATRKQLCHLHYQDHNGKSTCLVDYLINFQTKEKVEYLITSAGYSIRLDRIHHFETMLWNQKTAG